MVISRTLILGMSSSPLFACALRMLRCGYLERPLTSGWRVTALHCALWRGFSRLPTRAQCVPPFPSRRRCPPPCEHIASSLTIMPPNIPSPAAHSQGGVGCSALSGRAPYFCSISHHSARSTFCTYRCCSLSHAIHVSIRASSTTNPGLDHALPSDQNISAGADLLLCSPTSIAMTRFFEYHRGVHPC